MAMDFFEHQDHARRRTGLLVALLVLAVAVIIALVFGVVVLVAMYVSERGGGGAGLPYWTLLFGTAVGVITVVLGGSLYKTAELSGSSGGSRVARSLGGRRLDGDGGDPDERKLMNVVEEMAIASGTPVPEVYLLDGERGINAFAAGWSPDTAVIGVTRGSVQRLTRDELQGVIAHEFSHILNGDMRINLRLIGILFGILVISLIGSVMMRVLYYSGGSRRRSKDNSAQVAIALFVGGLALYIIGYAGVFFGRLIQAAISRQREYLADASAVQFTRNPDGIAGALKQIGAVPRGAKLGTAHASEHSHMFFGEAVSSFLGQALATHPPLDRRIKMVQPSWNGTFPEPRPAAREVEDEPTKDKAGRRPRMGRGWGLPGTEALPDVLPGVGLAGAEASGASGGGVGASGVEQIGRPTPRHVEHARELIGALPHVLRASAQTGPGAQAVAYALLLDREDEAVRREQLGRLSADAPGTVAALVHRLAEPAVTLDAGLRLPLLDLALPSLARMSAEDYTVFSANIAALIRADRRLDLFEWAVRAVIERHLAPRFGEGRRDRVRHRRVAAVREEVQRLLSTLAHAGSDDKAAAAAAMRQATGALGEAVELLPRERVSLKDLDKAVRELAGLAPLAKRRLIAACAACIEADHEVTVREAELMRIVAEVLGVPMPPLLPGQRLTSNTTGSSVKP